jgi:hypothetical protein
MEGTLILRVLLLTVSCFAFVGCAAVAPLTAVAAGGSIAGTVEVHSQTTVRLQEANFALVRTNVVGTSQGFKLLGFITLYPATLNRAMDRLYASAQAEHGRPQTLANLMIEHSGIYVVLFSLPVVTARADLIEFVPPVAQEEQENLPPRSTDIQPISARARIAH